MVVTAEVHQFFSGAVFVLIHFSVFDYLTVAGATRVYSSHPVFEGANN